MGENAYAQKEKGNRHAGAAWRSVTIAHPYLRPPDDSLCFAFVLSWRLHSNLSNDRETAPQKYTTTSIVGGTPKIQSDISLIPPLNFTGRSKSAKFCLHFRHQSFEASWLQNGRTYRNSNTTLSSDNDRASFRPRHFFQLLFSNFYRRFQKSV